MAKPCTLADDQKALIDEAAQSHLYQSNPVPADMRAEFCGTLADFVFVTPGCRQNLQKILGADVDASLQEIWQYALQHDAFYLFQNKKVNVPLPVTFKDGSCANISITRNVNYGSGDPTQMPWVLNYAPTPAQLAPKPPAEKPAQSKAPAPTQQHAPAAAAGSSSIPALNGQAILSMLQTRDYKSEHADEATLIQLRSYSTPLSGFAHMTHPCRETLLGMLDSTATIMALLDRDFAFALEREVVREHDGNVVFPISILRRDGRTPVEISMKRSNAYGAPGGDLDPWRIVHANDWLPEKVEKPGAALTNWAFLGNPIDEFYQDLADVALPEMWDFEADGTGELSILKSYVTYTFYRLQREGKVLENKDAGLAAFNTGLVNQLYEPIFACFAPNEKGRRQEWVYRGFCRPGQRGLGKELVATFNPLPERAEYFSRKEDLLYDTSQPLEVDNDHILLDNMDRLPLEFLKNELDSNRDAAGIIDELEGEKDRVKRAGLYQELREIVEDDARLNRRLVNRLGDARELALKRVAWNFRTAVPAFFPTRDTMSLLLPLDLTENDQPDIALVVEPTASGAYIGQTILTMRMAYNDARLICRPDSDWLNTSVSAPEDEDEEENLA